MLRDRAIQPVKPWSGIFLVGFNYLSPLTFSLKICPSTFVRPLRSCKKVVFCYFLLFACNICNNNYFLGGRGILKNYMRVILGFAWLGVIVCQMWNNNSFSILSSNNRGSHLDQIRELNAVRTIRFAGISFGGSVQQAALQETEFK